MERRVWETSPARCRPPSGEDRDTGAVRKGVRSPQNLSLMTFCPSQHHGAERRLPQHHPSPHRHLPEHGAGRRGGRGTGQHRHQVRPPALAGVPRGAGTNAAVGQRRPRKGIKLLPAGTRVRVGAGRGSGVAGRERGAGGVGAEPACPGDTAQGMKTAATTGPGRFHVVTVLGEALSPRQYLEQSRRGSGSHAGHVSLQGKQSRVGGGG